MYVPCWVVQVYGWPDRGLGGVPGVVCEKLLTKLQKMARLELSCSSFMRHVQTAPPCSLLVSLELHGNLMAYRTTLEVLRYYENASPRVQWGIVQTLDDKEWGQWDHLQQSLQVSVIKYLRFVTGMALFEAVDFYDIWSRQMCRFDINTSPPNRKWAHPTE